MGGEALLQRAPRGLLERQGLGERRDDEGGIVEGGEVDEEDPVGERGQQLGSEGGGEAGLARAPGTGEGDHGSLRGCEQLYEGGEVLFSADERSQAWGQVGGMGALGAQGGKVLGQSRCDDGGG